MTVDDQLPRMAGRTAVTLAERFIAGFRLPYVLGCALVGGTVFGFFSSLLTAYADTQDIGAAVAVATTPVAILIYALVSFAFYVPRYMRLRVEETGKALVPLHPDHEQGYRQAFAPAFALRPQVVAWLLFLAVLLLALSVPALMGTGAAPIQFASGASTGLEDLAGLFSLASFVVTTLALSSVVWSHWSVSMGIRRFGDSALELRPFYEDGFLGLKPIGSLALSLATAYFVFIGLFLATLLAPPAPPTTADFVGMGGLLIGLVFLGLLLFFLPMRTLHDRMVRERRAARTRLARDLAPWFREPPSRDLSAGPADLLRLDLMDRKVSAMSVWPFDLRILGRLSAIAASVVAILLSRIVALRLGV